MNEKFNKLSVEKFDKEFDDEFDDKSNKKSDNLLNDKSEQKNQAKMSLTTIDSTIYTRKSLLEFWIAK